MAAGPVSALPFKRAVLLFRVCCLPTLEIENFFISQEMKMSKNKEAVEITWLPDVEEHDYPAAQSYLSLLYAQAQAEEFVFRLRSAAITQFKAKDIFRASGLSLLGVSNSHVDKDRARIGNGTPLSPLLLVRDSGNGKLVIADGYHRLCAVYGFDEDAWIKCKII